MALSRENLRQYAKDMIQIIQESIPKNANLMAFANRDLKVDGIEGIVYVSTRIIRVEDGSSGILFSYRPSDKYNGPSPLSFDVPFFGNGSRIELECADMIEGYNLWVKDVEENFVQRKDFVYRGMDSALSQVVSGI